MSSPSLIYIAGRYTADTRADVQANIDAAEEAGKEVLLLGHVPVIPHRITGHWDADERFLNWPHQDWLNKFCLPLLAKCHVILMLPGWETSKGSQMELKFAAKNSKMIIFGVNDLREHLRK